MTALAKTIIATGASSGIGFEAIKQLLATSQPYKVIVGARNAKGALEAYQNLDYDTARHEVAVLPLELADLRGVRTFAQQALDRIGRGSVDYLLLNAGISDGAGEGPNPRGSRWCEAYVVNHLSQHYLAHLLRDKLAASGARVVFVSSGAVRMVTDPGALDADLLAGSGREGRTTYPQTKFVNLLAAQWWRRELAGRCDVVAVSPGLVPDTRLARGSGVKLDMSMPDARTVPEGAASVLRAFTRDDMPEDREQMFLTSWGEWWPKDVYQLALDSALQDKWCPSREEIEKEEGL